MDSDWDTFIARCQNALGDLVEGRPEPFKTLWSHADDVVIMGAFGGYERGWEQVRVITLDRAPFSRLALAREKSYLCLIPHG